MADKRIYEELKNAGLSRRDFLKFCGMMAGAIGLNSMAPLRTSGLPASLKSTKNPVIQQVARALQTKSRLPVIWLEFQDCAGCSEALTRSQSPTLVDLVLNKITVEYHETLSAAAGFQAEEAKQAAMKKYAGQYILVVEGSISTLRMMAFIAPSVAKVHSIFYRRQLLARQRSLPPATALPSAGFHTPTRIQPVQ